MVEETFEEEVICNFFHILQKQAKDKRKEKLGFTLHEQCGNKGMKKL
jgi:hypothetical protein